MDTVLLKPREMSVSVFEHRARVVENLQIARQIADENIQRAEQKMKELFDSDAAPSPFTVGDKVWVYTPKTRRSQIKVDGV